MRRIYSAKLREVNTDSASLRGSMLIATAIRRVNTRFGGRILIIWPWLFRLNVISLFIQSLKAPDLKEKLEESEKLLKEMRKTWEEKMAETEQIQVIKVKMQAASICNIKIKQIQVIKVMPVWYVYHVVVVVVFGYQWGFQGLTHKLGRM
ncbi:hypothetical protein DPMN_069967 [Dreissena polymorpha]|uniref:Uncharacterized protein n=1 Tax=Dreissena polymorpha TaxID=45954 RepID=A0A9D3YZY8_DREPO|nr:hypothetical protein DPMN_069967 [Dreissena polymorpha]